MSVAFALAIVLVVVVALLPRGSNESQPTIVREPPAPAGSTAQPPPPHVQFGANVNGLFNYGLYSPHGLDTQLRELAAAGATIARTDALWEATEPGPPAGGLHHYDWTFDDRIAGSLAAHGIQWLPILDYSAPWARSVPGQDHSAPRDAREFATWAAALADRYGTDGSFWREHPSLAAHPVSTFEVWNEPDNPPFWVPAPDPKVYADLYMRSRDAITGIDPNARVIIGGLVDPATFMPPMLHARPDLSGHIDGISIHPYGLDPAHVLRRIRHDRRALDSLGLGSVPLYVTEFGWATRPVGAPAYAPVGSRPGYIAQTLRSLGHSDCRIAVATIYTWVTQEKNPADREDWFGLAPPAGGPDADVAAFAAGIRSGVAPAQALRVCGA